MRDEEKSSKGFGFVCFENPDHAQESVDELNGGDLGLFACKALKKEDRIQEIRKQTERYKKSMARFNLYVKNIPVHTSDEELKQFFSAFGDVNNVKVMQDSKEN